MPHMICRFLANYEYAASSLTFLNDIVLHSEAEKDNVEPLNATTIGKFVKDLFEENIKKVERARPPNRKQIAYLNLARKTGETSQLRWPGDGASLKLDDIVNSVQVPQGWLSKVNGLQQISFVGVVEDWEFSRSRVILELALIRETELGEWKFVMKSAALTDSTFPVAPTDAIAQYRRTQLKQGGFSTNQPDVPRLPARRARATELYWVLRGSGN